MELATKPFAILIDSTISNWTMVLNWLNPNSEDFILTDPIGFMKDMLSWLNPFSDNFMLRGVMELFNSLFFDLFSFFKPTHENFLLKGVIALFGDLIDYINPFSDNFILKIAFVPSEGYFNKKFSDLQKMIFSKFPIIEQLSSIVNPQYLQLSMTSNEDIGLSRVIPPVTDNGLSITMPAKYGGGSYTWIDFSYFLEYRDTIFSIMRVCMWFPFIKWLYGRIPSLISGGMAMDYQQKNTSIHIDKDSGEVFDVRTSGRLKK